MILQSEIGKLIVGRRAEVSVSAFPGQSFAGRIYTINPIIDAKSKTVKVTIELADGRPASHLSSSFLRSGMFCTVNIETDILKDRLLIPKSALLVRDQRSLVFIVRGGLAKWQYVQMGDENGEYFEARSGISIGDTAIVNGHFTLAHDGRIVIQVVGQGK